MWNQPAGAEVFRMALACGSHYQAAVPGQFVTLRLPEEAAPLLRRPFSIHRLLCDKSRLTGIEILYKTVGDFTRKLSRTSENDRIDVLGPLGRGFTVSPEIRSAALVAGGIGVAPMRFLAESLIRNGLHVQESLVCIGGRTQADIVCKNAFGALALPVRTMTEDGSAGEKGLATDGLRAWLAETRPDRIYACGPTAMLRAVSGIAAGHGLPCEVSIETIMACGVGACLGCAIKDRGHAGGYGHVCIDGPVFNAERLDLE
ncbi:MAG TPA: dihydroorotate dehydrogenase electron transfer subunit [Desulfosalsimonadaceae bacterium]|nr:dihydroorotate dehydrogenase electron transfer subunit [Desulfosalsimonadaceae bacterium]